jgi:hypothetical protein
MAFGSGRCADESLDVGECDLEHLTTISFRKSFNLASQLLGQFRRGRLRAFAVSVKFWEDAVINLNGLRGETLRHDHLTRIGGHRSFLRNIKAISEKDRFLLCESHANSIVSSKPARMLVEF